MTADFDELVSAHRRELAAHCYRMLGSPQDAEDALQEALLAAWRGLPGFEGRSSPRTWLFRITTNACLRFSDRRPPRMLSFDAGPPCTDPKDLGEPLAGPWVEPGAADSDPAVAYARREGVELAFVAALQHLPGTQRAALILREVLGFSAAETAEVLGTTVPSVNSAVQRARASLDRRLPGRSQQAELAALGSDGVRALVDGFVAAWERGDVPALLDLLTEDARFTMPPLPAWFDGLAGIRSFLDERLFGAPWRLVPLSLNAQPAFACYQEGRLGAVSLLSLRDGRISWIAGFVDPALYAHLPVPEFLPPDR